MNSGDSSLSSSSVIDPAAPLQVSIEDTTVVQGAMAAFSVRLNKVHTADVSVNVKTTAGTAVPGSDYTDYQAAVSIPAGQISTIVNVQTLNLASIAAAKQFRLDGTFTSAGQFAKASGLATLQPAPFTPPSLKLSVGSTHFCALKNANSLYCWGENSRGQLGTGNTTNNYAGPAAIVAGLANIKDFTARYWNTCVLTTAGQALCWGWNSNQQLQPGAAVQVLAPFDIAPGVVGIKQVTLGYGFTCILTAQDTVMCKGSNASGQLGNGTTRASATFVSVTGLAGIKKISAGSNWACALTAQNTVKCWGIGTNGNLGNGANANSSVPVDVMNLADVTDVQVGYTDSCALTAGGQVKCWGYNFSGELGNGTTTNSNVPVTVTGLNGIKQLAVGDHNNCALTAQNTVKCWGNNAGYALGNTGGNVSLPVDVAGLSDIYAIQGGGWHNCTMSNAGEVKCWGEYGGPTGLSIAVPRVIAIP